MLLGRNSGLQHLPALLGLAQPHTVLSWEETVLAKSLLPSPLRMLFFPFLAPVACWNLPSGRLDLYKFSFIRGYLPKSASSKFLLGHGQERSGSPALMARRLELRSVCLLPDAQVGERPLGSPGI